MTDSPYTLNTDHGKALWRGLRGDACCPGFAGFTETVQSLEAEISMVIRKLKTCIGKKEIPDEGVTDIAYNKDPFFLPVRREIWHGKNSMRL
jgi:hypothetical protein